MDYTHVKCLKTVEDDEGIYCIEGKIYEILEIWEDEGVMVLDCEQSEDEFVTLLSLQIAIGDKDFEYLTLEDE